MGAMRTTLRLWPWSRPVSVGPYETVAVCTTANASVALAADRTHVIYGRRRGVEVCCVSGCVWATREGDGKDYVLRAAERVAIVGRGKIVVVALSDSVIRVSGAE